MPAWLMTKALWLSDKALWSRFDCVQNSYRLLARHDENEMLPLCADQGLGYTPFSPLAGGWLTGKYQEGQPYPPESRMTHLPGPYRAYSSPRIFRGLARLRACAAGAGHGHGHACARLGVVSPARDGSDSGPENPRAAWARPPCTFDRIVHVRTRDARRAVYGGDML